MLTCAVTGAVLIVASGDCWAVHVSKQCIALQPQPTYNVNLRYTQEACVWDRLGSDYLFFRSLLPAVATDSGVSVACATIAVQAQPSQHVVRLIDGSSLAGQSAGLTVEKLKPATEAISEQPQSALSGDDVQCVAARHVICPRPFAHWFLRHQTDIVSTT